VRATAAARGRIRSPGGAKRSARWSKSDAEAARDLLVAKDDELDDIAQERRVESAMRCAQRGRSDLANRAAVATWRRVSRVQPGKIGDAIKNTRAANLAQRLVMSSMRARFVSMGSRHRTAAHPRREPRAVHIGFAWFMPVLYFLAATPVAMASSGRL